MKPHLQVAEITTNAVYDESVEMGVDQKNIGSIIRSLTEMYTDAYLAVAREYISNSYDAMIESMGSESEFGTVLTDPIEVTLPSRLNPSFIVRDYGVGMSREVLEKVFPMYGASTKRQTNTQIGGFGLGAKSAFAIVSSFIVTSVRDGKKNVVVFEKDENGVGHGNFLAEQDTTDRNGTAVSISIPDPDRMNRIFRDSNLLLGFPHDSIKINGTMMKKSVYSDDFVRLKHGWVAKSLIDWENPDTTHTSIGARYGEQVVIVGPITYNVPERQLPDTDRWMGNYTVLNLPIGSVDLTPARDSLIYSDRTQKAIKTARESLQTELHELIRNRVEKAPTRSAALTVVENLRTAQIKPNHEWTYKGEVVPRKTVQFTDTTYTTYVSGHGWRKATVEKAGTHSTIVPARAIIVHSVPGDVITDASRLNRYRQAFDKHHPNRNEKTYVFTSAPLQHLQSKWITDMVKYVYTVDEFEAEGKKYREQVNAENRALRAANAVSTRGANVGTLPVSVLTPSGYAGERPVVDVTPAAELASASRVVYIQQDDNNSDSLNHKMALYSTNQGTSREWCSSLNYAIAALSWEDSGTVVVRLGKNIKTSNFLKVIPNAITMEKALADFAVSPKLGTIPLHFFLDQKAYNWVDAVKEDALLNNGLKEWVKEAKDVSRLPHAVQHIYKQICFLIQQSNLTDYFQKLSAELSTKFEKYNSPMLTGIYSPRSLNKEARAELVEWLNYKYPATSA